MTNIGLEGARESAYLRQVNLYRIVILRGHVRTNPGNTQVKFELHSFNRLGAITIIFNFILPNGSNQKIKDNNNTVTPKNLGGHVPFRKKFKGSCPDCP